MEIFNEYPGVAGIAEICKMLGVGRRTATHLLKDRKIPYIQIGREYKVSKPDVINFVLNIPMDDGLSKWNGLSMFMHQLRKKPPFSLSITLFKEKRRRNLRELAHNASFSHSFAHSERREN